MNYENQPCPLCGHHMHEEDDIVVCPVCATPQHRSCWQEGNACVNEAKHAEGFVWQSPAPEETAEPVEPVTEDRPEINVIEEESKLCQFCGTQNDDDALHCKNCGAPLGKVYKVEQIENPFADVPGFEKNEQIGDYTVDDFSLYTRGASKTYLPKFKKIAEGKKISFNIWGFLFAPYWFFYRKIYKAGSITLVLFAVIGLIFTGAVNNCSDIITPYQEAIVEQTISQEEMIMVGQQIFDRVGNVLLILLALNILLRLICALSANYIYYTKITKDFSIINERIKEENIRKAVIAKRGGTSFFSLVGSFLLYDCAVSLLSFIADLFA